jgi:N-acetylglutamate synthase-like GNAT family acetyltransferase
VIDWHGSVLSDRRLPERVTADVYVVRIRTAVARDLPALRQLYRRSSLSNEGDREALLANPHVLELPAHSITQGRTRVAVAADGTILGFATGLSGEGSMLEIEDLFVDPNWMRQGIGTRLIADQIAIAKHQHIHRLAVTANPHAYAFYRSVGFTHRQDVQTPFGPGSRMELKVDDG